MEELFLVFEKSAKFDTRYQMLTMQSKLKILDLAQKIVVLRGHGELKYNDTEEQRQWVPGARGLQGPGAGSRCRALP